MKRKAMSVIICLLMITSISASIAQNAGQSQNIGQPTSSSSGTGGLAGSPWPMFRRNLNHTGQSPYDTSGNDGQLRWNSKTDSWVISSPAIGSDGTIYVGSWDAKLYAINPDGTEKWSFTTCSCVESSPAIASDGMIYVGSWDTKLYAINPDGTEKWSFTTGGMVRSSPAIGSDGTIYIGSYDKKLYAINPDGTEKWSFTTDGYMQSSPAIDSYGTIYVGSYDKKLYAINPDGTEKWNFNAAIRVNSSAAIGSDGTIYVGTYSYVVGQGHLYAINPDGTEKWSFTTSGDVSSSPAIGSDGTIYVGCDDSKLYAINPDGIEKWGFTTGGMVRSSPAIGSDGTIYVGSSDNKLYAIKADGTEKWSFTTGGILHSSPAIGSGGTIYVGSCDGNLYAIETPTQTQPPVADAGPDQIVNEGESVQFDGSASYAPNGTIDSYEWDFDAGVDSDGDGDPRNDVDATGPTPTHVYGDDGVYEVTLTVGANIEGGDVVKVDQDCVFCIDSSGSMLMNDPMGLRIKGAQHYAEKMSPDDRAAVVGFAHIARLIPDGWPVGDHLSTDYPKIIANLGLITSGGGTYIANGLNLSNEELRVYGYPYHVPIIILLTDADSSSQQDIDDCYVEAQIAADRGVMIFTIGLAILPGGSEEILLNDLADMTGGMYYEAPDASHLDAIYEEISIIVENLTSEWLSDTDTMQVTVNNVAPTVSLNNTLLDTMDSGWTITAKSGGSATVSGGYSSARYTSPPTSIRAYLAYGRTDGRDYGSVYANKDFDCNRLCRLKIRYYIAQQTDVDDGWGGMAARAEVRFITHDAGGDHTYRYIVAASETDAAVPGPNDPSRYCEAQPDALFIDENNQIIPPPGDAEHEPPTGVWYTLDRCVNNDFTVDWSTVEYITIQIAHYGVYMYSDAFETYFDDLELTCCMMVDEGSPVTVTAGASDPGSDDLTFTWNWGDGSPDTVTTYYNDNIGPEPVYDPAINEIKSPWGTYPFNVTDTTVHTYGDDGVYNITLTVEDDDGGTNTTTISVTVNNVAPTIGSTTTPPGNEGSPITFTSTATDPGSDDLTFTWDWGDGTSSTITTYYNDGSAPDPYPSPLGIFPFTVTDTVTHTYGDNGIYTITLTVEDDDGGATVITANVTVYNAAPTITMMITPPGDEGEELTFSADATDPGSDDLSFTWEFKHGPTITNIYYNDGTSPDPAQSPGGNYPFNVSDTVTHTYGDDCNYTLVLNVTDDDGGITTYTTTVTIDNIAPYITLFAMPIWVGEGTWTTFVSTAEDHGSDDLTFEWFWDDGTPVDSHTHYNDGVSPDPYPSPTGTFPFTAAETVNHTYGDNSNYTLTLRVTDDDGGITTFTTTVVVHDVAPAIEPFGPRSADEGSPLNLSVMSTDLGSDDLTFTWEFEFGPTITNIYYNDGIGPDPYPSPWGTFPFSVADVVTHTYGDNGVYNVTLTVEDDDGGTTTHTTTITVNNVAPTIEPFGPFTVDEGSPLDITAISTDPGSDDLEFIWEFELGPMITNTYYNDDLGPDPNPSPWGTYPYSASDSVEHTCGDDGIYAVSLTVTDDDGGSSTCITNITVNNVAPTIANMEAYMDVNLTLRVAGEKYHSVGIRLYEDGSEIWTARVTRYPGSPDEQAATITGFRIDMTRTYSAAVDYLPNDPRVNGNVWGGNPVWIDITFGNGSVKRLHHTFNVRQSYWDSDHWNHIDPWELELNHNLVGCAFNITSHITDPGSDDEYFMYTYGSQIVNVTYLNNPPVPDPYPSPDVKPVDVFHTTSLVYEGPGTIYLTVTDDDGGAGTQTIAVY